jgi:RDD family
MLTGAAVLPSGPGRITFSPAAYPGSVARWTGEWLSGTRSGSAADDTEPPRWRGERLGLPESGVGSVAGGGTRLLALLIDLVLASLVTSLFLRPDFQDPVAMQSYNLWSAAAWAALTIVPAAFFNLTPGMAATGIRVGRLDGASTIGLWRALIRAALTFLIIPAAVRNADGRSWLDRLTGTVVVRLR